MAPARFPPIMRRMTPQRRQQQITEAHQAVRLRFILTELDLAITFCQLSLGTEDNARAERNAENARQAYKAATHFLEGAQPPPDMNHEIAVRMEKLRPMLAKLPQAIPQP